MSDHSHRGARPGGPLSQPVDRRVLELDEALRGVEAVLPGALPGLGFFRDATRAAAARTHLPGSHPFFSRGTVIHALPGVNWYKVQVGDGAGWMACCLLSHGTYTPLGPRDVGMCSPNDDVIVMKPRGLSHGFIVGVIPPFVANGNVLCPDWLVQGGNTGVRRERGHKYPTTSLYRSGGVVDWASQRPIDQAGTERGWVSPFGPTVAADDALIQVRVSEMAGLWMTVWDEWVRLAGRDLLIESAVHEENGADDEGESRYFRGVAMYPHEALGQYAPNQQWTQTFDDKEVQYTKKKGKVDVPDGDEDLLPIYRYQEYAGYLGQGHLRFVARPGQEAGKKKYKTRGTPDDVLFMESVGADGDLTIVSAKGVHIGKRCGILLPKPKMPHTAKDGDDAERENYKFSSLHGTGDDHKIKDVKVEGDVKSVLRVAGVMDLIAHAVSWKAVHPFYYHKADYDLPQPAESQLKVQKPVNFSGFFVDDPTPKKLKIDHRYGNVDYFERESFLRLHDDGSVHIAGGAGEELVFAGGRAYINAPMGVAVGAGGEFSILAEQIVGRAKGSVDFSSTEKDVRLKAERNMQFLAGNSGQGGMLLECLGRGSRQQYEGRYGEDVRGSGITIKGAQSTVSVLGKDVYVRTGGKTLGEGDILLDASMGKRRVQVYGREFHAYVTKPITFNFGPVEKSSTVNRVYSFAEKTMVADVKLLLGGKLIGYSGGGGGNAGIVVDGGISAAKSIACAGVMADKKGMFLGKVPGGFAGTVTSATNAASAAAEVLRNAGNTRHDTTIVRKYYQADQPGDEPVIERLKFSFRDPPGSPKQYKAEKFKLPEARWQQFVRFGLGTGGTAWTEKPVIYQGTQTYPWPGKQKWVDEPNMLRLSALSMFDAGAGTDKARPGPYEEPSLGSLTPAKLDGEYKLIR